MNGEQFLGAVVAFGLLVYLVYLVYALLHPERF